MYFRTCALAAIALGIAACATGGDDFESSGDDGGAALASDAADDGSANGDGSYGGYDSSTADAGSHGDAASGADGFPPPGDASGDSASAPDASSPDTGSACAFTGTLATFDLTGQTGSEVSVAATTSATGFTVGALTRSTGLTAAAGSGSINSSGWPLTATASATKYYTFTVTPPSGCTLALSTLALDVKASATGPELGDVATSADAFATHTASFDATSSTNVTLSATATSAIEVRVYGYYGLSASGTFRILDTLTLSGSTS